MRWQKDKDPLSPGREGGTGGGRLFSLLGVLAVLLTVCSFLLWDEKLGEGDISLAVSHFEEFFTENDAIAVFLGWVGR